MITDLSRYFDRLFSQSAMDVKSQIEQNHRALYEGRSPLVNRLRFNPVKVMALITVAYLLLSSPLIYRTYSLGKNVEDWTLILVAVETVLAFALITFIVIIAHFADSRTGWSGRWELKAKKVLSAHLREHSNPDELLRGLELSTLNYTTQLKLCAGGVSFLAALVSMERTVLGQEQSLSRNLLTYLGVAPAYQLYLVLAVFILAAILIFIFIYVPLAWRQQFKPFLEREVEDYRARNAQPAESRNWIQRLWKRFSALAD